MYTFNTLTDLECAPNTSALAPFRPLRGACKCSGDVQGLLGTLWEVGDPASEGFNAPGRFLRDSKASRHFSGS
jgi:hypothetical protein